MKKNIFLLSFIFTLCISFKGVLAKQVMFSSTPLLEDNSMLKVGYFNFDYPYARIINVSTRLNNFSNKKLKITNEIYDSFNQNGAIIYNKKQSNNNNKISNMVIGKKKKIVYLEPNSSKTVSFKLKPVSKESHFLLLGSLTSYAFTDLGKLTYNNTVLIKKNVPKFNIKSVHFHKIKSNNNSFTFYIKNKQENILENSTLKINILTNNNKSIKTIKKSNYSMIGNSKNIIKVNFPKVKKDNYKVKVKLIAKHKDNEIIMKNRNNLLNYIIVIISSLIFISIFFVKRRNK